MNPEDLFGVDLSAVRDRLKTLGYFTDAQDIQAGADALSGLTPFIPPAAFVSIARETYEPNRYATGAHGQRGTAILSFLFCVPSTRADKATGDEVEQARKAIAALMKGWQPPGAQKALELVDYRVRLIADGLVWGEWQMRTTFDLTIVGPA